MDFYSLMSALMAIAVLVAYLNHRFIKMPVTIAIMASSLLLSVTVFIAGSFGLTGLKETATELINRIDFTELLLNEMLGFLLFAGSLTLNKQDFLDNKWQIGILATLGTLVSSIIIGGLIYYTLLYVGHPVQFIYCLLFGALISPTDPIAVLSMCKDLNAPKDLTATIAGESLFNDGVGIVIFLTIYQLAFTHTELSFTGITFLFLQQTIGGIVYGIALGFIGNWLIKNSTDHKIAILITLVMTSGGYILAHHLGVSGPLAMVAAGLFIGYQRKNIEENDGEAVFNFWEVLDEILNALLFLLLGFQLFLIPLDPWLFLAAAICILIVLGARIFIIGVPFIFFKKYRSYPPHIVKILTWGGLRGGLAVALALNLPSSPQINIIQSMTYWVVVFSIIVQGLTIKQLIKLSSNSSSIN